MQSFKDFGDNHTHFLLRLFSFFSMTRVSILT